MAITSVIKFLSVALFAGIVVVTTTLLWPRFTNQPRPEVLRQVHKIAMDTSAGQEAADVLGVSIEAEIEPVNIVQLGMQLLVGAGNTVKENINSAVYKIAGQQIVKQYINLPESEKQEVRAFICEPEVIQ